MSAGRLNAKKWSSGTSSKMGSRGTPRCKTLNLKTFLLYVPTGVVVIAFSGRRVVCLNRAQLPTPTKPEVDEDFLRELKKY